jgi:hypothetical protein
MEALLDYSHQTLYFYLNLHCEFLIFWRKIWTKTEEVENFATIAYNIKRVLKIYFYFFQFFLYRQICVEGSIQFAILKKIPNGGFLIYKHGSQKLKKNHITTFITSSLLSNSFIKIARGIWHSWNWQFFDFWFCFSPFRKTGVGGPTTFEIFEKKLEFDRFLLLQMTAQHWLLCWV